ncbi:MAG: cellulose-binding protein, partial [Methylococcus sp.]|nr:cellulose-binding protein [Methylococcus sp.]
VQQALDCPLWAAENGGSACVQHNIRAIAIAPYFGYYLGLPENLTSVDTWASQSDGGLTSLFGELLQGGGLSTSPVGGALEDAHQQMLQYKATASLYGTQLVAYEGGQHVAGVGSVVDNDAATNLFMTANRDSRMGETYRQYLDDWCNTTGELINLWTCVGDYSKWGSWGLLEYRDQGSSPKFDAVKGFISQ